MAEENETEAPPKRGKKKVILAAVLLVGALAGGGAAGNSSCVKKFVHQARNHGEMSSGRSGPRSRKR